jgi:hypothetical protein
VELYTLAREHMDVDELFKDIANEIDSADRVMGTHREEIVSWNILLLTRLGLPIAAISLLVSLLAYMQITWETIRQVVFFHLCPPYRFL